MTELERLILFAGYIMTILGGGLLGRAFYDHPDYRILIAYLVGGSGALIIGASKS